MNTPATRPSAWALALGFLLIYTSWGTTYFAMSIGVGKDNLNLPPALFGGARVFLAGVLLLLYQALQGSSIRLTARDWPGLIGVSWLLFVGGNGLMNVAMGHLPSSVAAVLAATTPLWMGLCAMAWPGGERLSGRGWLGLVIGLSGVALIKLPGTQNTLDGPALVCAFFALGSAFCWGSGSLVLRHLRTQTPHLTTAAYQMILGGGSLVLVGWVLGEFDQLPEHYSSRAWWTFGYLLIVGSLIGFVAFNWLLGHVSAAKVGTYAYVNPMVAIVVGWFTGEIITAPILAGIVVILVGVFLVRTGERPPTHRLSDETTEPVEVV